MMLVAGASFFALLLGCLLRPANIDEAWILVVARRVLRGETVYRDVFFGTGPAPLWLLVGGSRLAGVQVWVLRLMCALSTAAVAFSLRDLGVRRGVAGAMVAMVVLSEVALCSFGGVDSLYVSITKAAALGTVLCLATSDSIAILLVAGCLTGFAISSKYTIGIASVVGGFLLISRSSHADPGWVSRVGLFTAAAGLVSTLFVLPVAAQGGLRAMLFRLGRGKSSFLRHGTMGLRQGVAQRRRDMESLEGMATSSTLTNVVGLVESTVFASALSLPLMVFALVPPFASPTKADVELISLALIWITIVAPRADFTHVLSGFGVAASLAMLALERAGDRGRLTSAWVDGLQFAVATWAGLIIAIRVLAILRAWPRRATRSANCCKFILSKYPEPLHARTLEKMSNHSRRGNCFLVGSDAPAIWLITDLHNPTPYDYPLASTFGPHGEADVANALSEGSFPFVAVCGSIDGLNQPRAILAAIDAHFTFDECSEPRSLRIARLRPLAMSLPGAQEEPIG
jgi:hypothetical protein